MWSSSSTASRRLGLRLEAGDVGAVGRFCRVTVSAVSPPLTRDHDPETATSVPAAGDSEAAPESRSESEPPRPWWLRPILLLGVVAAVHAALPILILGRHWFIGIDESVYLSQINAHVPPGGFSAPRARGSTFLAAPVTAFTSAVVPMREWTTLLSGLGLFLAFRPWLRLRSGYVVPLAAALFASIWTVTYYGFQVMPNEWVAFAVVGACGSMLNFLLDGRRWALVGASLALGAAALLRPSDAAYAFFALAVAAVLCRVSWKRRGVAIAVLALGSAAGVADWVIEAYISYGGLSARITAAQAEQGGSGLYWAGSAQARVLAGTLLCRDGCTANAAPIYWLWWVAGGLLLVVALMQLRRMQRPILDVAPLVLGLVMAAQYVFSVPYAAPRFMLPAYAALALPCASGSIALVRNARTPRPRLVLAGALTLVFLAHAAIQVHVITRNIEPSGRGAAHQILESAAVLRKAGITGKCVVMGPNYSYGPLAYRLRCSNRPPDHDTLYRDLRTGVHVAWIRDTPPSHLWGIHWKKMPLPWLVPTDVYVSTSTLLKPSR
jgi:hypothetical protein